MQNQGLSRRKFLQMAGSVSSGYSFVGRLSGAAKLLHPQP